MAKFVYIYQSTRSSTWEKELSKIQKILGHIHDDPYQNQNQNELVWCSTSKGIKIDEFNLTTGSFSKESDQFTFKLKVDNQKVTLTPDIVASRSVWYYTDSKRIIISTSQRTIISILNKFELNEQAISWMMSCGTIGPSISWDKRIKAVEPHEEVIISKERIIVNINSLEVESIKSSLEDCFHQVFQSWELKESIGITLSGGWDSRAVAYSLSTQGIIPKSFTWGFKESIDNIGTDASIAKQVATKLNLPFQFIELKSNQSSEEVLSSFITESEGRIDHINTFINGFSFWENVKTEGNHTVIRADEAFGWLKVSSPKDLRISLDINLPKDYENLDQIFKIGDLKKPEWPKKFLRQNDETLSSWRDRLYREFRIPGILAALQDPMLSYVEIVNPLLHKRFILWAMQQSDFNRTNKRLYKKLIQQWSDLPAATVPSIPEVNEVLTNTLVVQEITTQLHRKNSYFNFNSDLIQYLDSHIKSSHFVQLEGFWKRRLKKNVPFWLKKIIRNHFVKYTLGVNRIAFRAYIVLKMMDIIENDLK